MPNISTFKSLKEISAIRFHEIKFEGSIKLIDKDYEDGKQYSINDIQELQKAWLKLYDEYFERTDSTHLKQQLKHKEEALRLLIEMNIIEKIIDILRFLDANIDYLPQDIRLEVTNDIGNKLKHVNKRLKFDIEKPIKEQISKYEAYLGGVSTRYQVIFKQDQNEQKTDIMTFYNVKSSIETVLGRNLDEKVNMLQWLAYEKDYKKRLKKNKHE